MKPKLAIHQLPKKSKEVIRRSTTNIRKKRKKEAESKPTTNITDQQRLGETPTVGLERLTDHEAQKQKKKQQR